MSSSDQQHLGSLHRSIPAALKKFANAFHGGSIVLVDSGSADAIGSAAGFELLAEMGAVSIVNLASPSLPVEIAAAATLAGGRLNGAVIFLSILLDAAEKDLISSCARLAHHCSKITIACSVSEAAHHDEAPGRHADPATCYVQFASIVRRNVEKTLLGASVPFPAIAIEHCPLTAIALMDNAFVLPSGSGAATAKAGKRPLGTSAEIKYMESDDEDENQLPRGQGVSSGDRAHGVALLAHALAHVAAALGVRPEVFCLGPAADAVGRSLSFVPPYDPPEGGPSSPSSTAAFVLVDRGLDLTTPLLHSDLLVERIWEALRDQCDLERSLNYADHVGAILQEPWRPTQAIIPMLESSSEESLLPGSLLHPHDTQATANLGFLIGRPGRDAALFVRKWLREAARREGVQVPGRMRSSTPIGEELRALIQALSSQPPVRHRCGPLLQLATATVIALEDNHGHTIPTRDLLAREERAIVHACAESSGAVCEQLVDVFTSAGRGGPVDLVQAVNLSFIAHQQLPKYMPWYAASSGNRSNVFTPEQETILQGSIADAVVNRSDAWAASPLEVARREAPWLPIDLLTRLIDSRQCGNLEDASHSRRIYLEIKDVAGEMLARCRNLTPPRFEAGSHGGNQSDVDPRHSADDNQAFLLSLTEAIVNGRDVKGLKHASTSLAGLLKSGLGRLGLQRQPRPSDYPTVVLFVIGGVSLAEIHRVLAWVDSEAARAKPTGMGTIGELETGTMSVPRVLVGGSSLLMPSDIIRSVLL